MEHKVLHPYLLKRVWGYALIATACLLLLAACGSTSTTNNGTSGGTTPTATSSGGGAYGYGSATPTATSASSSGSLVATATATVAGKSETILTNAQGLTLYYRTSDAPPATVCSGGCAAAWPPLLASGSAAPTSSTSLPGTLTAVANVNGNQVEYNGHPLYTYVSDTAAGQTTGQGLSGVWYVATPSLK